MRKELLEGLTEEQIAKFKPCENDSEEILKLAKEEGLELSDEQLEAVAGGSCFASDTCSRCGRENDYTKTGVRTFFSYVP